MVIKQKPEKDSDQKIQCFLSIPRLETFLFQKKTWLAYLDGKSGLVHAPTGTGKTFAVWILL